MKAGLITSLVLALLGASFDTGVAGETRVDELLRDPLRFQGRTLVLRGTVTKLQTHTSRKGDRYYSFHLSDDAKEVLVLMNGRPTCKTGTMVTVHGRLEQVSKRVDATAVSCEQDPGR